MPGQLHRVTSSDRYWASRAVSSLKRQTSGRLHGAVSSDTRTVNNTEQSSATNSLEGTQTTAFLTKAMAISSLFFAPLFFAPRNQCQQAWAWCMQRWSRLHGNCYAVRLNGTKIRQWCGGDGTANSRLCVPFKRNGTERKRHRFYASYCTNNRFVPG